MIRLKEVEPLFIFEMANNHMGSVDHGLRIIREFSRVKKGFPFHFGFKLQYRHLNTFIHPDYKTRIDVKYVKRFQETRLMESDFKKLKEEMVKHSFITVCTPFDERSVDLIEEHGFDIIKIGSCSFTDWPLIERVAKSDKPIIASTAGASLDDIDKVVSFFDHRGKDFGLMHCVAEYPTEPHYLQLNQIDLLRDRYMQVPIGFSTHEAPNESDAIKMAVAKGARIFEKHVGVPTPEFALNNYSATPKQTKKWLKAAAHGFEVCGIRGIRHEFSLDELQSLQSLRRGVFTKKDIYKGERIRLSDVFFALPTMDGQITANDMSKYVDFYAQSDIAQNAPVLTSNTRRQDSRSMVYAAVQEVKELLQKSRVVIPPKVDLEISHHYGMENFHEYGLTLITIVNREYCKKLMILLPGQKHPEQYHKAKEETFHVLHGDVQLTLDGIAKECKTGEFIVVERNVRHSFGSTTGAIIEEISSTHHGEDSFYTDPAVTQNDNRKTLLTYWLD